MGRGRRAKSPSSFLLVIATTAIIGGLVVFAAFAVSNSLARSDDDGSDFAIGVSQVPESLLSAQPTVASEVADGLTTCTDELAAADELVSTARSGVDNWSAHIQARTDGLSGTITNEEMREIWRVTRLAGPDDVSAFEAAEAVYDEAVGGCDDDVDSIPGECLDRADLATTAAAAARVVIAEWAGHLANMALFADGGMTAHEAQHEWEEAWSRAPDDIVTYEEAIAALEDGPDCESEA